MEEKIFKILLNSPDHSIGVMEEDEQQLVQTAVNAYLRGETVCFLEYIHKKQWQYFYERTKGLVGKITVWCPLPVEWPVEPLMEIKIMHTLNIKFSSEFNRKRHLLPVEYNRKVDSLTYDFILPYGSWQHEREPVMQALERLNVLDKSIYSRPPQNTELQKHINIDYLFPIHSEAGTRTIEQTAKTITHEQRFQHDSNIFKLYDASKKAHCWVVLDNYCLNDDMLGTVSEKVLYPIRYGVPFIYVGNQEQRRTLARWGVQPNDPCRSTVRGVAEQMQWLRSIFRDPKLAQQWQDHQGERIISNLQVLEKLPDLLKSGN
jgi:hypothetical protein|tara:strand:+ start:2835 stop:3788 length:954 start_codon:yes stop_codon:yes gene_type:complete